MSAFVMSSLLRQNQMPRCNNLLCKERKPVRIKIEKNSSLKATYSVVDNKGRSIGEPRPLAKVDAHTLCALSGGFCQHEMFKPRVPTSKVGRKVGWNLSLTSPLDSELELRSDGGYSSTFIRENDFPKRYSNTNPPPKQYKSAYGNVRTDKKNGVVVPRWHSGWDFYAPINAYVYAMADSRVVSTVNEPTPREEKDGGRKAGWQVQIAFTCTNFYGSINAYKAAYCHLNEVLVNTDQCVAAGAVIGLVGDTGNADEAHPHLHLTLWRRDSNNKYVSVNPEELFGPWTLYVPQKDLAEHPPLAAKLIAPPPFASMLPKPLHLPPRELPRGLMKPMPSLGMPPMTSSNYDIE